MMNKLIKELGGYDAAKAHYDEFSKKIAYPQLRDALLEHRREHNIFEVGDLTTHLTTRAILKVVGIEDSSRHYRVIKVEALNPKNDGSVSDCFNSLWFQLKHATDEEIKAGYRL